MLISHVRILPVSLQSELQGVQRFYSRPIRTYETVCPRGPHGLHSHVIAPLMQCSVSLLVYNLGSSLIKSLSWDYIYTILWFPSERWSATGQRLLLNEHVHVRRWWFPGPGRTGHSKCTSCVGLYFPLLPRCSDADACKPRRGMPHCVMFWLQAFMRCWGALAVSSGGLLSTGPCMNGSESLPTCHLRYLQAGPDQARGDNQSPSILVMLGQRRPWGLTYIFHLIIPLNGSEVEEQVNC